MPIFTTEIAGRPTVAFAARDYASALKFVHMDFIRSELRDLRAPDGAPLWNGQANLVVRDATEEEKVGMGRRGRPSHPGAGDR